MVITIEIFGIDKNRIMMFHKWNGQKDNDQE